MMKKPNVIVFFTDQQRWDTTGVHGNPPATSANRLKFEIEFCNHHSYDMTTDAQWQECSTAWLPAFRRIRRAVHEAFKLESV